jgi:hypothetical protein
MPESVNKKTLVPYGSNKPQRRNDFIFDRTR